MIKEKIMLINRTEILKFSLIMIITLTFFGTIKEFVFENNYISFSKIQEKIKSISGKIYKHPFIIQLFFNSKT